MGSRFLLASRQASPRSHDPYTRGCPPALCVPHLRRIHPQVKDTPDAPATAAKELAKLGPMSTNEVITAGACACMCVWCMPGAGLWGRCGLRGSLGQGSSAGSM